MSGPQRPQISDLRRLNHKLDPNRELVTSQSRRPIPNADLEGEAGEASGCEACEDVRSEKVRMTRLPTLKTSLVQKNGTLKTFLLDTT